MSIDQHVTNILPSLQQSRSHTDEERITMAKDPLPGYLESRGLGYRIADRVFDTQVAIVLAKEHVLDHVKQNRVLYGGLALAAAAMATAYRSAK